MKRIGDFKEQAVAIRLGKEHWETFRDKEITVIAIAHRLSTIKDMDRIIVMEHGQIVEDVSLEELLSHIILNWVQIEKFNLSYHEANEKFKSINPQ